jgi:HK97 family phage major capsid protein
MPDKITKNELETLINQKISDANKPILDKLERLDRIDEIQNALEDIRKNQPLAHGEVLDEMQEKADTIRLFKIASMPTKMLREEDWKWVREYQDRLIGAYIKDDATFDTATTTQGGYLLGVQYIKDVVEEVAKDSVIRPMCTIIPVGMKTGKQATITAKVSAARGSEETAKDAVVDTFGQLSYSLTRIDINVLYSREMELFDNTTEGLYNMLVRQMGEAIANLEESEWIEGSGSSEPEGILNATVTVNTEDAGNGKPTYDGMVNTFYKVPMRYRNQGVWVVSATTTGALRNIKNDVGTPLWVGGFGDTPDRIFGRPVVESEFMTNTDIVFGNFKYYHIFEPQRMWLVATSEGHTLVSKRQIYIGAWKFNDGKAVLGTPFCIYDNIKLS